MLAVHMSDSRRHREIVVGVHAEHDQERRGGKGQVCKELKMERRQKGTDRRPFLGLGTTGEAGRTHQLEDVPGLKTRLIRTRVDR